MPYTGGDQRLRFHIVPKEVNWEQDPPGISRMRADVAIDADVDLHLDGGEYFHCTRFNVSITGPGRSPCSTARSGNIAVRYNVV